MSVGKKNPWWSEEYKFFGSFYMKGDDSKEGYLIESKQELEERTLAEVDGVVNLLRLKDGSRILDCPCGYGRHSIELASRGFVVTGSDINSEHLQSATAATEKKSFQIAFKKENMLNLKYCEEFDAVINMFYSFGFFDTDEENERVLENFFNALTPGGQFLMHTDVNIPRVLAGKYKEAENRILTGGGELQIIDSYDPGTKRMNGSWIIKNTETEERKDYSVRVYTKDEFEELCRKIGFSSVVSYADWSGNEYTEDSEDMIVVATK